jgi:hypothetical protein
MPYFSQKRVLNWMPFLVAAMYFSSLMAFRLFSEKASYGSRLMNCRTVNGIVMMARSPVI